MILSVYMAGQAAGTLVGGLLTDSMDRVFLRFQKAEKEGGHPLTLI